MSGDPHPVFQDGVPPQKANARSYLPLRLGNADDLRALDGLSFWVVFLSSLRMHFYRDQTDMVSADNGQSVIIDASGQRWKAAMATDSKFDAYDTTANQAIYAGETEGFRLFLIDAFGGDGGWVVRDDAGPGGWFGPFPTRGPRGGDRYDLFWDDPDQPISGEVVLKALFATEVTFPAGMLQSKARVDVGPASEAVFSIRKNGVPFATCTFAAASTTGVFACPVATTFEPENDDELTIVAPDPMDASLRRPRMTISGARPTT